MTETVARFLAGCLLIAIAAGAGAVGFYLGRRRGRGEGLRLVPDPQGRPSEPRRSGRPPRPPSTIH